MAHEKEIIRDTSIFTVARYAAYFFTVLTGLIIAKVLGPAEFGVYSVLILIINYSHYSHFGLLNAVIKKVPFYIGKKNYEKAKETEDIAFTGATIITILISLALIILSFFIKRVSEHTIKGLIIIALIIILKRLYFLYQNHLRVEKRFITFGKNLFIYSLTYFILIIFLSLGYKLGIPLIVKFKIEGILIASLVSYLFLIFYIFIINKFRFQIKINKRKTIQLVKIGFPLLTMGIMYVILTSIDKIMIIKFIDKVNLGYYSIAVFVAELIYFVPQAMAYVVYPHFLERYGKNENKDYIKNHLIQPTLVISYLLPIMIGLVFISAPFAIYYLLPKYVYGVTSLKILVCAIFFMSIVVNSKLFLITINKERHILFLQGISIVIAVILNYIFIKGGYGIMGVAIATAITYFIYSTSLFFYSFKHYINRISKLIKFFIKIYLPFLYIILILVLFDTFPITGNLFKDIIFTSVKLLILLILSIPLLFLANKKTGVIKTFLNITNLKFFKDEKI